MSSMTTETRSDVEARMLAAIEETATQFPALTRHDRCDACSAAALAQVSVGVGPNLLFCGHHFRRNWELILAKGYLYDTSSMDEVDAEPYTGHSHAKPWPNQFRDAGSATA